VRFVMRVREDLGSTLPLRAFLSGPTIAELADTLREESGSSGELTLRASLVVKVAALSAEQVEELLAKTAEGGEPS
jgi:hypothetical protein